jgi:predicted negative regulator of RcsB-dependent stress response
MNKKSLIVTTIGIALVWGGWLIYRNNRNNKINASTTPYEEALKKLEKIK